MANKLNMRPQKAKTVTMYVCLATTTYDLLLVFKRGHEKR